MAELRSKRPLHLYLIRHAEVVKNLHGQHGGGDETVTERGLQQIAEHAQRFSGSTSLLIAYQPDVRSRETALRLAEHLRENREISVKAREIPAFKGINMGAVAGLSDKDLTLRYPRVALSYLFWRAGCSLRRPKIAGAESIADFATRILHGLEQLLAARSTAVLVVGTTSTLLTLHHLLSNDGTLRRQAYRYYSLDFGAVAQWRIAVDAPPRSTQN